MIYYFAWDSDGNCECEWFPTQAEAQALADKYNGIERGLDDVARHAGMQPNKLLDLVETWLTAKREELKASSAERDITNAPDATPLMLLNELGT